MSRQDRSIRFRLGFCLLIFLLGFLSLTIRAWRLQTGPDERVSRLEDRQLERRIVLSPQRGTIYDVKGRELALSLKVPSVFGDPKLMNRSKSQLVKLAKVLNLKPEWLKEKTKDPSRRFVWLKRHADPSLEKKLSDLDFPGIHWMQEWSRFYPAKEVAAQVVGFVGLDGTGLEGLEFFHDKELRSPSLKVVVEADAKGRPIYSSTESLVEPEKGKSLRLTIDLVIQHIVETQLKQAAQQSGSKSAMGVLMDPFTGEVLSMASYPPVNPNLYEEIHNGLWRNRPVEETFEPGSILKIFTLAAALEKGTLSSRKIFLCKNGSLSFGSKQIRNSVDKTWLDPRGILKFSSNIGAARIALDLGQEGMVSAFRSFGFGEKTGIDFPGEAPGLFWTTKKWKPIELANIAFGQGMGVTAIQMVSALSMIANGGFSVQPRLVSQEKNQEGTPRQPLLSSKTLSLIVKWMQAVTEPGGTGAKAAIPGYTTAGKTGTSQNLDPENTYSHTLFTSSFIGFAPVSHPRIVALFVFKEPSNKAHGGELAGPVFRNVMLETLTYLGVPPDQKPSFQLAKQLPPEEKPSPPQRWDGSIFDFRGLTIREVLDLARSLSIEVKIEGSGVAFRQEPLAQKQNQKKNSFRVYFSNTARGSGT